MAEKSKIHGSFHHEELSFAIAKVNQASLKVKKQLLTAMALAITKDGEVTIEEAEMFRAVSESLDCPVPPVVSK